MTRQIRGVIFDWGGTLTPWHDIDLVAQWQHYVDVYAPLDESMAERLMAAEIAQWRDQQVTNGAAGTGTLDHIWASVGVDVSSTRHRAAMAAYLSAWDPHTLADPEAKLTLQALADRGLLVGVLSNTMWPRSHHEQVFKRDDLHQLIDAAVYSSEIPVAKPHLDAFTAVLSALDLTPEEAVFVGDRPWDDVYGAQQVGMRAALIPHSRLGNQAVDIAVEPDAVLGSLGEIVGVVDRWMSEYDTARGEVST
ncbi:MAG: HAD family hydrolase [Candidatus Nanopelagicales bacterium]